MTKQKQVSKRRIRGDVSMALLPEDEEDEEGEEGEEGGEEEDGRRQQ